MVKVAKENQSGKFYSSYKSLELDFSKIRNQMPDAFTFNELNLNNFE